MQQESAWRRGAIWRNTARRSVYDISGKLPAAIESEEGPEVSIGAMILGSEAWVSTRGKAALRAPG